MVPPERQQRMAQSSLQARFGIPEKERTGHGSDGPKHNYSSPNFLAIPAPNKWRGNKNNAHDKDVIRAKRQEWSRQDLRNAQSRMDQIRLEQEQASDGSLSDAQVSSQETMSAPGNVVNGRHIHTTRNGLTSYGLGRSG